MATNYENTEYIALGNMGADITGDSIDLRGMKTVSFICDSTGATNPAGVYIVQVSNDNSVFVTTGTTVTLSGTAGISLLNVTDIGSRYVRLFWDFSSGSGSFLNVSVHAC